MGCRGRGGLAIRRWRGGCGDGDGGGLGVRRYSIPNPAVSQPAQARGRDEGGEEESFLFFVLFCRAQAMGMRGEVFSVQAILGGMCMCGGCIQWDVSLGMHLNTDTVG